MKKNAKKSKRKNALQVVKGKIRAKGAKRDEKGRFKPNYKPSAGMKQEVYCPAQRPAETSSLYITTITNTDDR